VRFLVLYLGAAPEQPMARAAVTVAEVVGRSLATVERVLLALREREVIDVDNRLADEWAVTPVTLQRYGSVTAGDEAARRRELTRLRVAKCRANARANAVEPSVHAAVEDCNAVTLQARSQEEERDDLFKSEQTGAREPERQLKRRQLYKRAIEAAPLVLSKREHRWFIEHMSDERFERFLARGTGALNPKLREILERLFARTQWRSPESKPPSQDIRQGWMMLPVEGGATPRISGVTEEERLRRYHQRMRG
jgi:hypothetical protein